MTFFLALSVIKSFSSIFVHQEFANKRALPHNSLLLGYVIKRELPEIWSKFEQLELNIEAFFGIHFASLFSNLLAGDVFGRLLVTILEERLR